MTEWIPIAVVALVAGSSLWAYQDASARCERGEPVVFSIGQLELATPAAWAAGCLCLWFLVMPLYLTCRKPIR